MKNNYSCHALWIALAITALAIILLMGGAGVSSAEEWNKTFGGTSNDGAWSVQQTSDSGYILAGYTYSYGAGLVDAWLIKTDSNGNKQWDKTFGSSSTFKFVQQTSDGGYIVAGDIKVSGNLGDPASWLVKTDSNGNNQWNKTFMTRGTSGAASVQQTSDGGYILAGSSQCYPWLIKTDANGNQLWNRTFGEQSSSTLSYAYSVRQTSDGGYVLAGRSGYDAMLIKTDVNGNLQWEKIYGGQNTDEAHSVQQTSDGGYVLVGNYGTKTNTDAWLIKTDSNGNKVWDKTYGGIGNDGAYSVQQTSDGGYILAGMIDLYGTWNNDASIIKTDSNGNQQWDKTFGGVGNDYALSVQQTSDGGYVLAGGTSSYGSGGTDAWLIKVDVPTLSISASVSELILGTPTSVTFSVTSSGTPISGATIIILNGNATGNGTTDANGKATFSLNAVSAGAIIVTASKGGYNNATTNVIAIVAPLSAIAGNSYTGTANVPINFIASASGGYPPYAYSWNFGEGTSSNQQNPTYTYTSVGTFTATLTVTDSEGETSQAIATVIIAPGPLANITISAYNSTITIEQTQQFIATGSDANGNTVSIIPTWSSSNTTVGTITSSGLFTALKVGTTTITATSGLVSGTASVTVIPGALASLIVLPSTATIIAGETQNFIASGYDASGNSVAITPIWSSTDTTVGNISSSGLFIAIKTGTITITATSGSVSGTANITVAAGQLANITTSPSPASVYSGQTQQFNVTGKDANGNTVSIIPEWSSSNTTVGTITSSGLFTGLGAGTTTIIAINRSVNGTATVTVTIVTPTSTLTLTPTPTPTATPTVTPSFTATPIQTPTLTPMPTPTPSPTPTSTPPTSGIKGDASGDGQVTVVDALFVAQYTVGLRTLTSQQLAAADVNGDGQVTVVDALFIAQYTVGLRQL